MTNVETSTENDHPLRAAVEAAEAELATATEAREALDSDESVSGDSPEYEAALAREGAAESALSVAREALVGSDCPRVWILREEGYDYATITATSAAEALDEASSNVDRSNYPSEDDGTMWISVEVRCEETGEEESCTVTCEAEEPECVESEHDWRAPYSVLGGLKENPGVWGHGGGVIIKRVCAHCGCYQVTDTWAQNRETGEQGLTSVSYDPADDDSTEWVNRRKLAAIREALESSGYDLSGSSDDERLILAVSDETLEEGADGLEAIRAIAEPLGGSADWTGGGDGWGDGSSTSDVRVELAS